MARVMEILRDFVARVPSNYRALDIPREFPRGIPSRDGSRNIGGGVSFGGSGGGSSAVVVAAVWWQQRDSGDGNIGRITV